MKISAIQLYVLEAADQRRRSALKLNQVANLRRIQYTHTGIPSDQPLRQNFIEVVTDTGISGRCTTAMLPHQVEILRNQVLGEDVRRRERIYQMLHKGTRWLYQPPGWFGDFDNCLWDILGKAAGLPVYALLGRVRDRFPVYLTSGDGGVDDYLHHIEQGKTFGINAYKFHTYKGGEADIPIFQQVRKEVGQEYGLINDPVCSYDLREAIEVGRVMEELGFIWLEEPFHEQKLHHYQTLCRELTMPVMANEMLMHDVGLSAQWLIQGGTDRLRANARHGTTQVLKMAHFAELHGANVELNAQGGLAGLIHAHLGCCIDNTDFYEYFALTPDGNRTGGELWGILNGPLIEEGHIAPPDGPGWGTEWDEDYFRARVVAQH